MKKVIEVLAYKVDSFDNESFAEDVKVFSKKSIILFFNKDGVSVHYKPDDVVLKKQLLKFIKLSSHKMDYIMYPFVFCMDHFRLSLLFLKILIFYKVNTVVVENTFVAGILALYRKLRIFKRLIYLPGDWLAGCKAKKQGLWSNIGSNSIFPIFDFMACRGSDITLNCTKRIAQEREAFWGKKITNFEAEFQSRLVFKITKNLSAKKRNKVLFMGKMRQDSGLELIVKSLSFIRKEIDISLKIFGAINLQYEYIKNLAKDYGVEAAIEFHGYLDRERFEDMMSDCFCGINLITSTDSYTAKTLPAKVFDYLQYLLPVIVTENIGQTSELVKEFKLGEVINSNEKELVDALKKIFESQPVYRDNIIKYIKSTAEKATIAQFFDMQCK
ncbi:MAG: glycosyltransferase [Candidatus Omnitrophica bacterium]|nr:glycosyltransferase [Candidatus Omnitrophota bacterium]